MLPILIPCKIIQCTYSLYRVIIFHQTDQMYHRAPDLLQDNATIKGQHNFLTLLATEVMGSILTHTQLMARGIMRLNVTLLMRIGNFHHMLYYLNPFSVAV